MTAQTVGGEDINVFEIDVKIIFKVSFSVKENVRKMHVLKKIKY